MTNEEREELQKKMETMTIDQILLSIIANEAVSYHETEDQNVERQNVRNICELTDRYAKVKEVEAAEKKTEAEQDTKIEMNKLDNEVKLKIARMEKSTAEAKIAIDGCEGLVDILAGTGKALGAIALTGLIANWECEGYVPGKSGAFRFMSDLGKAFIKK